MGEPVPMWRTGQIETRLGLDKVQIRRYALLLGYPQPGSGSRVNYLHHDVEAFVTLHKLQTAITDGAGAGGLASEVQRHLLAELADHTVVTINLGPATLTVTRLELEPPT